MRTGFFARTLGLLKKLSSTGTRMEEMAGRDQGKSSSLLEDALHAAIAEAFPVVLRFALSRLEKSNGKQGKKKKTKSGKKVHSGNQKKTKTQATNDKSAVLGKPS